MNTYNPNIKIYYGQINSEHRLLPAPDISIGLEYNYSNDTIIGYTYIVNLSGQITALDLRALNNGDEIPDNPSYGIGAITDHINKVRNILTQNGSILHIVKSSNGQSILKAKGGILRSLSFDESPNNWVHYASYTATIEFNSVDFGSDTENCTDIFLDPSAHAPGSAGIVDINKFKIKSFQDGWSFTFDENEAFNKITNNDININLNINNRSFNIQYNISATGKHFFSYDNETTGQSKILPAFQQAKNFVQYRLYEQVTNLLNGVLKNSYSASCSGGDDLSDLHVPGSSSDGLLENIGDNEFRIFNEQISCESSESDGSFSAIYSATVMTTLGNPDWSSLGAKHTVSKNINKSFKGTAKTTNISVNGSIQGYLEGGIINSPGPISLPDSGAFIIYSGSSSSKYNNAKTLLDKIYNESDYGSGLGESGKRDLKKIFKDALGITLAELDALTADDDPVSDPPHPISFNLTHDYNNGTINYSLEYSSTNACGKKYQEINVQISNPTKVTATFNIPNSNTCPIIQELGTKTAKTVSVTIRGFDHSDIGRPEVISLKEQLDMANPGCLNVGYLPPITIPGITEDSILTQRQYTKNPMDGSYSLSLNYICSTKGCK